MYNTTSVSAHPLRRQAPFLVENKPQNRRAVFLPPRLNVHLIQVLICGSGENDLRISYLENFNVGLGIRGSNAVDSDNRASDSLK